jgi:V/A-type H+/Na+-transporting ATPase subunit F
MRTYVLGSENCVLGFSMVGVDGRAVHSADELTQALDECLADRTIGLLLVSADSGDWARERIDALKANSLSPLVVEVPGEREHTTYSSLKDFVQRAVGISLGGT